MLAVIGLAVLAATSFGFYTAGLLGALTGLVGAVGIGSGLAIFSAARGTEVSNTPALRNAQRAGGLIASVACAVGVYVGGWHAGWMWGAAGYVAGVVVALLLGLMRTGSGARKADQPGVVRRGPTKSRNNVPLVSPTEFIAKTTGGWSNRMDMSIYEDHRFECACGQGHRFAKDLIEVTRELSGMRLVFACPVAPFATCVKVKGLVQFQGFESLFGADLSDATELEDT